MENYNYFAQQGWQCPVCRRVYSPSTPCCFYCGAESTVTTSTTLDIDELNHESVTKAPFDWLGTLSNGGYTFTTPLEEKDDTSETKGEEE